MFDNADDASVPKVALMTVVLLTTAFAGCINPDDGGTESLTQTGSSTVLPLAQRWAEQHTAANVDVSGGGSSNGLNALLSGEAEMGDASRKIGTEDYRDVGCEVSEDEIADAQSGDHPWQYPTCNGVTPTEWVVAYDVLSVVVHPSNDWIGDGLTYEQMRSIFTTENTAETWDEVPGLEDAPSTEIQIYAPDEASGTYDFFFEEVSEGTGKSLLSAGSDRYSPSSDDNVILSAIASNEPAIGFFGLAYYLENEERVQAVPVASDEMDEPVRPSFETASDYPITRPIHVYTDGIPTSETSKGEALRGYLAYTMSEAGQSIVPEVGYVKVSDFSPAIHSAQQAALT